MASEKVAPTTQPSLKRNSNDVGWEYGILCDPKNPDRVKCKLCLKEMSGGVYRIKEHVGHIPGNVTACPKSLKDDQVKCKNAIVEAKKRKVAKKHEGDMLRAEVNIDRQKNEDELEENFGPLKHLKFQGPMDRFATTINPEAPLGTQMRQQNINDAVSKDKTHKVQQYCARWIYQSGIPFNAIDNGAFKMFCEALGQFGPGWIPPTQYQLREPLLKEEEERTRELLKSQEAEWDRYGCSIMTDGWTDRKKRSIMNLCVNSRGGTCFLSSKDASTESHTGLYIFEYIDRCIGEVGAHKVVQVVTDNALNNVAASKMLKEKRPNIFWTGCAAHTIDLMLEAISKLPKFAKIIDQAKALTIFIYAHHKTLAMMRSHTKKRDIVRPGVTRFATSFLTLQSLLEKKIQLKAMFNSEEWDACKHSQSKKGKDSFLTVMSSLFWNGVIFVLKVFGPLVKLLRVADGEKKPSMGFIFGELLEVRSKIKLACNDLERNYKPIFDIIDEKMKGRLDSPLHMSAYLLNPFYFYKDTTIEHDQMLIDGFVSCVETFYYGEYDKQDQVVNEEFNVYKTKSGAFARGIAVRGCEQNDSKFDPGILLIS